MHFLHKLDNEVLLHLFAAKGDAMVAELRGMFALPSGMNWNKVSCSRAIPYGTAALLR